MSTKRRRLGEQGERLARQHLSQLGYTVLESNFRNKLGEVDLIARDGEWLVVVEVRTRTDESRGHPFESVTTAKQKRLRRLAQSYLSRSGWEGPVRFDVIGVIPSTGEWQLEHLKEAF